MKITFEEVKEDKPKNNKLYMEFVDEAPAKKTPDAYQYDSKNQQSAEAFLANVGQGLTFNTIDELSGAVQGVKSVLSGGDYTPAYEQGRDQARSNFAQFSNENPYASTGGQVVGSIAQLGAMLPAAGIAKTGSLATKLNPAWGQGVTGTLGLAQRLGAAGVGAGVQSGLASAGEAEGGALDRSIEGLKGVGYGAPMGVLGQAGGEVAGSLIRKASPSISNMLPKSVGKNKAERYVESLIQSSNRTPKQIVSAADDLAKQYAANKVTPTSAELLSASNRIDKTFAPTLDAASSISQRNAQRLGEFTDVRSAQLGAASQNVINKLNPNSSASYTKDFLSAQEGAQKTASAVRKELQDKFGPLYKKVELKKIPPNAKELTDDIFQKYLSEVRSNPALNSYVKELPDNSIGTINLVQTRMREAAKTLGEAGNSAEAKAVGQARTKLLQKVEDFVPVYKKIQKTYVGEVGDLTQLENQKLGSVASLIGSDVDKAGKTFFSQSPDMISKDAKLFYKKSPEEYKSLLSGFMRQSLETNKTSANESLVQRLWPSQDAKNKWFSAVSPIKGGKQTLKSIINVMEANDGLMNQINRGSKTAAITGLKEGLQTAMAAGTTATGVVTGNKVAMITGLNRLLQQFSSDKFSQELTDVLLTDKGIKIARELANIDPKSTQAQKMLYDLFSTTSRGVTSGVY